MKTFTGYRCSRFTLLGILALASCSSSTKVTTTKPASSSSPDGGDSSGSSWANMGFDVQSTYNNTKETKLTTANVASLTEVWKVPILVYGTPVVVGNRVYAGGTDGIYAFDTASGEQVFKFADQEVANGTTASMAYENDVLYIAARGHVLAVNVKDDSPTLVWDTQVDAPNGLGFSAAILSGDYIITGESALDSGPDPMLGPYRGGVAAVKKSDGSVAWNTHTASDKEDGCAVWGAVAIDPAGGSVFAPVGNNYTIAGPSSDSIMAFDFSTGAVKWSYQATTGDLFTIDGHGGGGPDADFGANPVVFDYNGQHLVAGGEKNGMLFVWDRDKGGDPVVQRSVGNGSSFLGGVFQALAFDGEHLIVICNQTTSSEPGGEAPSADGPSPSVLYALAPDTLDTIYERQLAAAVWSPLTIANGVGFFGEQKTLEAIDVKTGQSLFTFPTGGTIPSGISISNGRIFFGSGLNYLPGLSIPDGDKGQFHALALP